MLKSVACLCFEYFLACTNRIISRLGVFSSVFFVPRFAFVGGDISLDKDVESYIYDLQLGVRAFGVVRKDH